MSKYGVYRQHLLKEAISICIIHKLHYLKLTEGPESIYGIDGLNAPSGYVAEMVNIIHKDKFSNYGPHRQGHHERLYSKHSIDRRIISKPKRQFPNMAFIEHVIQKSKFLNMVCIDRIIWKNQWLYVAEMVSII